MIKSIESGKIDKSKNLMLNITGGGENRFKSEKKLIYKTPDLVIDNNTDIEIILKSAESLF